jgi:hypothetical protein
VNRTIQTDRDRAYEQGRPTTGWKRGRRINDLAQVKPGDMLIVLSHRFRAENLIRVLPRERTLPGGFDYEYADCETLKRSDGHTMFCHGFELAMNHDEYFHAKRQP